MPRAVGAHHHPAIRVPRLWANALRGEDWMIPIITLVTTHPYAALPDPLLVIALALAAYDGEADCHGTVEASGG